MNSLLDKYINYLFEGAQENLNAPEFAFYTLYGKVPKGGLRGRGADHPKKKVMGIEIDKDIPTKAIKELFKIKEIEMRSSCQGSDEKRPSFIIFRPFKQNKIYVKRLVDNLNKQKEIKAAYNIGKGNKFRVCVTWKTWAGKEGNEEWWLSLPNKIKQSL